MADVIDLNKYREQQEPEGDDEERCNLTKKVLKALDIPYVPCVLDETAITASEHTPLWQLRLLQNWILANKYPNSESAKEMVNNFEGTMTFLYNYVEALAAKMDELEAGCESDNE